MAYLYLVPNWFVGYDVILELLFAIITLVVSYYAFKVYKLTEQRQIKLFGFAFLLISISYFIQSALNFMMLTALDEDIARGFQIQNVRTLAYVGVYTHILFFVAALVTLTYMGLKVKSSKTFSILAILSFFVLALSSNKFYAYYFLSSILLIFICMHYVQNYWNHKQTNTLLVLIAFTFLLFGSIHFILSVNHAVYYFIAHTLELVAYILILINLILVVRK